MPASTIDAPINLVPTAENEPVAYDLTREGELTMEEYVQDRARALSEEILNQAGMGSYYWAESIETVLGACPRVIVADRMDESQVECDYSALIPALHAVAVEYPHLIGFDVQPQPSLAELYRKVDIDAQLGDMALQQALFGEVRYS